MKKYNILISCNGRVRQVLLKAESLEDAITMGFAKVGGGELLKAHEINIEHIRQDIDNYILSFLL